MSGNDHFKTCYKHDHSWLWLPAFLTYILEASWSEKKSDTPVFACWNSAYFKENIYHFAAWILSTCILRAAISKLPAVASLNLPKRGGGFI